MASLYRYGLYRYGLYSYGLYSYGLGDLPPVVQALGDADGPRDARGRLLPRALTHLVVRRAYHHLYPANVAYGPV